MTIDHRKLTVFLALLEAYRPIYDKFPVKGQVTAWGDPWEAVRRVVEDAIERGTGGR